MLVTLLTLTVSNLSSFWNTVIKIPVDVVVGVCTFWRLERFNFILRIMMKYGHF